jgi:thioredoxin-like negative regulator of GroEL
MKEPIDLLLHRGWSALASSNCYSSDWTYVGCYISLGNYEKAQELLDQVPALLEKKKLSGKDLPTEVFIKKRSTLSHPTLSGSG